MHLPTTELWAAFVFACGSVITGVWVGLGSPRRTTGTPTAKANGFSALLGGFTALLALGATRNFGEGAAKLVYNGWSQAAWLLGASLLVWTVLLATHALASRRPQLHRPLVSWAVAIAVVVAALFEGVAGTRAGYGTFGDLWTHKPSYEHIDAGLRRPTVTMRTNRHGLRGPDFNWDKSAGVTRGVVIGDSFVEGAGLQWPQTIAPQLRKTLSAKGPDSEIEVINLGHGGHNLGSMMAMLRLADARLSPDFAVLMFSTPNDLNSFDQQDLRRLRVRPSAFSLGAVLLGDYFVQWLLYSRRGVSGGADVEAVRTAQRAAKVIAARPTGACPLFVMQYFGTRPNGWSAASSRQLIEVPPPANQEGFYIPGDGHPTARANRAFAKTLARRISEIIAL